VKTIELRGAGTLASSVGPRRCPDRRVYPNRPITLIVPYTPEGIDILARVIAQASTANGASSGWWTTNPARANHRGGSVAKAAPNGYTPGHGEFVHHGAAAPQRTPYDPIADFTPIAKVALASYARGEPGGPPVRDFPEFVAAAKAAGRSTTARRATAPRFIPPWS
jgi:tripartite-type tricarboxylate transporter receptor subunit TctC